MRVLMVTNPNATAVTDRERDVVAHALASEAELEVAETENRGHAAALACRAMRSGDTDAVVALGGDGTVNEVVNGLLTDGPHPGIPALGIVPGGSTNVFVRAVGLPDRPIDATAVLLQSLRTGRRRPVSMGCLDGRWFVFAAGIGYDAAIVEGVEQQRRRGKRSTHALYARVGLRTLLRYDRRHPRLHVELPDGTTLEDVYFAIVANSDPWTYAGSRALRPTPDADFESDLALYARRRMGVPGLAFSMARMAMSSPRVGRRGAHLAYDLTSLVVRADEPVPVQVDGDFLAEREKMTFTSARDAISVLI